MKCHFTAIRLAKMGNSVWQCQVSEDEERWELASAEWGGGVGNWCNHWEIL